MKTPTSARSAGTNLLLLATCVGLLACDSPDLRGRTELVDVDAAEEAVDDISLDQEPVRAVVSEDDPPKPEFRAQGVDKVDPDIVGLRWSDAERGAVEVPEVEEGEWTIEVRAHAGKHRARWVQGPYDADEVRDPGLMLEPPADAFVDRLPEAPVLVMARLVLTDTDGNRAGALALPDLVMHKTRSEGIRFALQTSLTPEVERDGDDVSVSADLPDSL